MSDQPVEPEVPETPAPEEPTEKKAKKVKDPIPDGFVTPVHFAKIVGEQFHGSPEALRPQQIYGYIKNSKTFPYKRNTDGAFLVPRDEGIEWYSALEARRQERAAAKAKTTEAAATPAEVSA